jgi:hypothetical protein
MWLISTCSCAGYAHKAAKGIVADAADKPAVAAKAGDAYRHVGRRAAGDTAAGGRRFPAAGPPPHPQNPNFCIHAVFTSMLNLIKPV